MVRRFQIEDMMTQDASGVVFRALDTETGLRVAVRRFFPFGVNGGGLSEDEQADYNVALERLSGISHPAMRSIIAGGCDPVDGMPFIATEWVEGVALQAFLERGPLTPAEATHLLTLAMEVCEQISQVLGEEAMWVETNVHTIIVGAEDEARGITFWISPLKWLGKNDGERGLASLVSLTEDVMGWRGKMILDHDGEGLGSWLKWLREAPKLTTLHQAREKLAAVAGTAAPAPVRRPLRSPVRAAAPVRKKRKSSMPFVFGGILSLATIALGGWGLIQWNNARLKTIADSIAVEEPLVETSIPKPAPAPEAPVTEVSASTRPRGDLPRVKAPDRTPEQIRLEAIEFSRSAQKADQAKADKLAEIAKRNGVHYPGDSELLLERVGDVVTLEGTLGAVERSSKGKGKTIYLIFSGAGDSGKGRGGIEVSKARGDLSESALAGLIGKKLRIEGTVRGDGFGRTKIPVVMIEKRKAIKEVP
jgi:hypothetical protein